MSSARCSRNASVEVFGQNIVAVPVQVLAQLIDAALGPVKDLLCDRRTFDAARRVTEECLQQLGFWQQDRALHVAGRETIHRVGDRHHRQGTHPVRDRGEVRGFLRVAAEQNGVA